MAECKSMSLVDRVLRLEQRMERAEQRLERAEACVGIVETNDDDVAKAVQAIKEADGRLMIPRSVHELSASVPNMAPVVDLSSNVVPPPPPEPPVHTCCPDNIEHQVVRFIRSPSAPANVIGDGSIAIKSNKTGEYVPIFCCPFCNRKGN